MTLTTIISLVPVALNISYIMAVLVVCIRKRRVEKAKDKSQQDKPANLTATSTPANQEEKLIGDTAKHDDKKVVIVKQEAAAATPGTPQQLSQLKSTATQQTQKRISDDKGKLKKPNDKQVKKSEDRQKKDVPQKTKDVKKKKNEKVRYEQYKSVKRRKKETKKGAKSETAKTQKSDGAEEKSKEGEIMKGEEDDEEEDDTMKGIASLRQDLNIVSIEE